MASLEPQGVYQCGICKRDYRRLDHLSRHIRSHTQSRPHKCHICSKGFTRTDLLKRHVLAHNKHNATSNQKDSSSSSADGFPLARVALACKTCANNHLRCTEDKPCKRCVDKGIKCIWDTPMDAEAVFASPANNGDAGTQNEVPSSLAECRQAQTLTRVDQPRMDAEQDHASGAEPMVLDGCLTDQNGMVLNPTLAAAPYPFFDGFPTINLLSSRWPQPTLDFDVGIDAGLDDLGFPAPDRYNPMLFELAGGDHTTIPRDEHEPPSRSSTDPGQPAAMCAEAFRDSHWHFRPNAKDYAGADDHNLSLPQDSDYNSPESHINGHEPALRSSLSVATRDKILTMIVQISNSNHLPKAILYFPSAQLLNTLVQLYLNSPLSQATSFMHAPNFNANDKRPELLAAMAANGAMLTSDPVLTRAGFAIAECTRLAIARLWDSDNTLVRDLQLSQAFYIVLETGLWSGQGRRVEIAESFLQALVTMMRRAGHFRRASYPQPDVCYAPQNPEEDHRKWLAWVESESFKRLAFRLLQHDTSTSMALLVNPVISYTEVQLPVPDSAALWSAPTAEKWKQGLSSSSNYHLLTVGDILDDPDSLTKHREYIDIEIASLAVISLVWMLTWEYSRMVSFQRLQPRQFNALIAKLRLDELVKLLGSLSISLASEMSTLPGLAVLLQLIHLHLYMPFEDIQIFAGMQGDEQARAVYPAISEWVSSESARRAVFHAGQIIRASRTLPHASIRGPQAIMIYYASLALWVYGLLLKRQSAEESGGAKKTSSSTDTSGDDVYLDGPDETMRVRRFIEFGTGKPCIRSDDPNKAEGGPSTVAYLDSPDAALTAIITIVQRNFGNKEMALLTNKLIYLMGELRQAARRSAAAIGGGQ